MVKPSLVFRATQWSSTLKLPRSTFPPRPVEAARAAYLQRCSDHLYALQSKRPANDAFVLHDGPPYANGSLHIGHALNKIVKDIICRFHISQGRRVQYVPGWDCHGLPIEIKALKGSESFRQLSAVDIRTRAKELASAAIQEQKEGFKQWAVIGDWENAYLTMDKDFELRQLRVFKDMVQQGLIYRQFKPVHWSPSSGTALAEAELEYDDEHKSLAAYIKFKISKASPGLEVNDRDGDLYALIWTTTPWTIPANRAIAVGENIAYCIFQVEGSSDRYIVSQDLLQEVIERAGIPLQDVFMIVRNISGHQILKDYGLRYVNPFRAESEQPFLSADFVSDKSGTGLVHMAPGHGFDDYNICRDQGIDASAPVDDQGRFTAEAHPTHPNLLKGKEVLKEGSQAVLELLSSPTQLGNGVRPEVSLVWATHDFVHKYPIDWRTKLPTIIRATAQWFADVGSIKNDSLRALDQVCFLPEGGKARLQSFISGRNQWCISRQRVWGVPIPALYASDGSAIMDGSTVEHIINVISERGIDAWWEDDEHDQAWLPPGLPSGTYKRGRDTMDVWFDSGTSWALLPERNGQPRADVYFEGTDQHRGWFQSSLLTYVAHKASKSVDQGQRTAPFQTLITHGFTLDHLGRKMSKSIGNTISPQEIMSGALLPPLKKRKGQQADSNQLDAMGPDALRLWVASSDYTSDVVVGETVLKAVNTSLHKYRVTFKWLLGALADYDPATRSKSTDYRLVDYIALSQLSEVIEKVHGAYSKYDFVRGVNAINTYVNSDLSAFYFETAKDHLYTGGSSNRLRVQHVCYAIFRNLMSMLGPILPILITEVLDYAAGPFRPSAHDHEKDLLLSPWGPADHGIALMPDAISPSLIRNLFEIHGAVKAAQETARTAKKMGSGLDCHVELHTARNGSSALQDLLQRACDAGDLADMFVVSSVSIERSSSIDAGESAVASDAQDPGDWAFHKNVELSPEEGSENRDSQTIKVSVRPPRGAKCPRCWRSVVEMQEPDARNITSAQNQRSEEIPICDRCNDAITEQTIAQTIAR